MKMIDVFDLPVIDVVHHGYSDEQDEAAAHAINCHDELVDALKEAIKVMLVNGFDRDCVPVVKLEYTLKKAGESYETNTRTSSTVE